MRPSEATFSTEVRQNLSGEVTLVARTQEGKGAGSPGERELGQMAQQEQRAWGRNKRGPRAEWGRTSGVRRGEQRGSKGAAAGPPGAPRAAARSLGVLLRHDEERDDSICVTFSNVW